MQKRFCDSSRLNSKLILDWLLITSTGALKGSCCYLHVKARRHCSCKYYTSNAAGIRWKTCEKMATGKSWMNYYSMTTMRIEYEVKDQKSGIMKKWTTKHDTDANDDIHACVTFYYTDVNENMNACVTPHNAHSTEHIH